MGASVAAACGGERIWASTGRSEATTRRAADAELSDVGSLAALVDAADTIVSVCPPDQAATVAEDVAALGFVGTYVDANAIAPERSRTIAERFAGQATFVDGGIIGPPARRLGTTRMYLSGDDAEAVAERWADSALEVRPIPGGVGAASALKMAYAAWTKGSSALLLAVHALAVANGVDEELAGEWSISQPDALRRSEFLAMVAPKAWRFEGEMREIADSFRGSQLPSGFHSAAAELYGQLAEFKDVTSADLDELVAALLRRP